MCTVYIFDGDLEDTGSLRVLGHWPHPIINGMPIGFGLVTGKASPAAHRHPGRGMRAQRGLSAGCPVTAHGQCGLPALSQAGRGGPNYSKLWKKRCLKRNQALNISYCINWRLGSIL